MTPTDHERHDTGNDEAVGSGLMPEPTTESTTGFPGSGQVGARTGMFGVRGSGDTSGYGGLVHRIALPPDHVTPGDLLLLLSPFAVEDPPPAPRATTLTRAVREGGLF